MFPSFASIPEFNKHLMTDPNGNSKFCFPETLYVPRGEAKGNIEVEEKQNYLFPEGPVIKCFVIPLDSKIEKQLRKDDLLDAYGGCARSTSGSRN